MNHEAIRQAAEDAKNHRMFVDVSLSRLATSLDLTVAPEVYALMRSVIEDSNDYDHRQVFRWVVVLMHDLYQAGVVATTAAGREAT